ncbi:MAG: NAD-dependent epimerase/dehydratase family protein [Thermoguttaceae bacterium]
MNLVIGGTGFLGGEIIRQLLRRGQPVRSFCRRRGDVPDGVDIVLGDLADRESLLRACHGVETVYHTASIPSISVWWKPFYQTNVLGTQNVVEACQSSGVRKLIYTSSASVTFDCRSQENVDETLPYPSHWLAFYPKSKAIAEQIVLNASKESPKCASELKNNLVVKKSLLTCSLRPHLIIGDRDRHLFPRLFKRAERNRLYRVGDGKNLIDIIFVENAAIGHIQAAEALTDSTSPVNGNAYFLSQGEPVNCWDWIDEVLSIKGFPKVSRSISFESAWYFGGCLEAIYKMFGLRGEPWMTRFLAAQLAKTHYLNIDKARRDFGYSPEFSLQEGMDRLRK